MDVSTALTLLFTSAFISATLLPGNSEAALLLFLHNFPDHTLVAVTVATLGNTLGGLTSYWIGRVLPRTPDGRAVVLLRRWGTPVLFLSWVPLIGDLLCVGAGWLRQDARAATLWIALGKAARYAALAGGWFALT